MYCDIFSDLQNIRKIVQRILTYSSPRFFKCQQLFFYLSISSLALSNLSSIISSFPSSSSAYLCMLFPKLFTSKLQLTSNNFSLILLRNENILLHYRTIIKSRTLDINTLLYNLQSFFRFCHLSQECFLLVKENLGLWAVTSLNHLLIWNSFLAF